MDPFSESYGPDVHPGPTVHVRDAIRRRPTDDLQARVEDPVSIADPKGDPGGPPDLQGLIELACENGRYDRVSCRAGPDLPPSREDATRADGLLRGRGLR